MRIFFTMKPVHFIFYGLVLLLPVLIPKNNFAQGYKISISSEKTHKSTGGFLYMKTSRIGKILPVANGGFITLVKSWKNANKFDDAFLVLQDAQLGIIKERDMFEGIKSAMALTVLQAGDKIFFVYGVSTKKNFNVYLQEVNSSNLELAGAPVLLQECEKMDILDSYTFSKMYSPDSSKILLMSQFMNEKNRFEFVVLNNQMNKLFSNTYTIDKMYTAVEVVDNFIDNDGTVYMNCFINIKNNTKRYLKEGGVKIPAYELHLLKINEKGGEDMLLPTNGMFIETAHAYQEKSGYINIAGIYKQDYDENPSGTYRLRFLSSEKNIKFRSFPFPAALAGQFEKNAKFPHGFGPSKAITNGEELYLFEQYYTEPDVWGGTYRPTFFRDILFCSMLPNDTVQYTLIKREKQKDKALFSARQASFYLQGDVFKLWYNAFDDEAKDKKEGLYITTISKQGVVLSTDLIVEKKQMEGLVINNSEAVPYGKGFITAAYKDDKGYLCRIVPNE